MNKHFIILTSYALFCVTAIIEDDSVFMIMLAMLLELLLLALGFAYFKYKKYGSVNSKPKTNTLTAVSFILIFFSLITVKVYEIAPNNISSMGYLVSIMVIIVSIVFAYCKEYYFQKSKKITLSIIQQHIIYQTLAIFCLGVFGLLLAASIPTSYQFIALICMSGLRILMEKKLQHKFLNA